MSKTKPFAIPKESVWQAYLRVKRNKGAAGVDNQSMEDFEVKLKDNLYNLWNRMSSGSYFPPPVKTVAIPKKGGGERYLGIPTVADRIAQMVVTMHLEPCVEPYFDADSYGYRPNKSALEAVGQCRQRCWKRQWVLDLDIKGFFDSIDHEMLIKAVQKHTPNRWVMFYVKHWLRASVQHLDGSVHPRNTGTPQGGVISPLLANIFLHYAFDKWIRREYPNAQFERYADDIVIHCHTKAQAEKMKASIEARLAECKLQLHPQKTKVVFCGSGELKDKTILRSFDFLGYTFRRRLAMNKQREGFVTFLPAVSNQAKKTIQQTIRGWRLYRRTSESIEDIAKVINPQVRGWVNYYGRFYCSELTRTLFQIERHLRRWAQRKFASKTGLASKKRARRYVGQVGKHKPKLFIHWQYGMGSPAE